MSRLFLDHAATTPLLPEVADAMIPWLGGTAANPSSSYAEGRKAKEAIDRAREIVSESLGSLFGEICFTAGGTEAANLAMLGVALGAKSGRNRILMSGAEHHCVLHTAPVLSRLGFKCELITVDRHGIVDVHKLREQLGDDVLLVATMHANNELGTFNPISEISSACRNAGSLLFVDAVQTVGQMDVRVDELDADIVSLAAHKFNGPKGAGALYVRSGTAFEAVTRGGGQEREVRAGTENVAGIVGLGHALAIANSQQASREAAKSAHRAAFLSVLDASGIPYNLTLRDDIDRLSGHLHFRIPGVKAESMLIALDRAGVSASSGAACSSGSIEPSHVLLACGFSQTESDEALRFTFGWEPCDAKLAAEKVVEQAQRMLK